MHKYSRASIASAFSNRALSLNDALGRSKSSVENFLKYPKRFWCIAVWLISRVSSASSVI